MYVNFGPSGRQILAMLISVCVLLFATHWLAYTLGQRSAVALPQCTHTYTDKNQHPHTHTESAP